MNFSCASDNSAKGLELSTVPKAIEGIEQVPSSDVEYLGTVYFL